MIERIVKLFTLPKEYWNAAIAEPGEIKTLLIPQMAILAAIPALANFLGQMFIHLQYGGITIIFGAIFGMLLQYGLNIATWIGFGYIIDNLATSFGAQRDLGQSMKLATGAIIPPWIASIISIIPIPHLGMLFALAGFGYGAYLLFLGLPIMNGTPQDKAATYTAVSIIIMVVIFFIAALLISCPMMCVLASSRIMRPY
jgi:hypothetical protein